MLFPGIKKLGKTLKLMRSDSIVMGPISNCYVRLYDGNNKKMLEFLFPEISESDKKSINDYLISNKVKTSEWSGKKLIVTFYEHFIPYSIKKINNIINFLLLYAKDHYPSGVIKCQKCNNSTELSSYTLGNVPMYICVDCLKGIKFDLDNDHKKYDLIPKNYLKGSLGAFFLSLPGIILTVILFIFLGKLAAVSAVVYFALALKGYSLFHGKNDKIGAIILTLISLFVTYLGTSVSYALMILYKVKSVSYTIEVLKRADVQNEMNTNIYISLFICALFLLLNLFSMISQWQFPKIKIIKKI